ncbi:TPA: hypothetical protein ACH3X2_006044 [Trebouxia sp. C0005]
MPPNAMHPTPQAQVHGLLSATAQRPQLGQGNERNYPVRSGRKEPGGSRRKQPAAQGFTEPPVSEAKAEEQLAEKGGKAEAQRKHRNADLMQFMI